MTWTPPLAPPAWYELLPGIRVIALRRFMRGRR